MHKIKSYDEIRYLRRDANKSNKKQFKIILIRH